jgi:hypothetical protein
MTPNLGAGGGDRGSVFAVCLEAVRERLLPEPAVTITLTDGERAAAMAAVHAASCRRRGVPPLPQWFLALPPEEQLRRWQEALDRGDYEPYSQARDGVYDWTIWVVPDIVGGSAGSGLPYGLRELPPREDYDPGRAVDLVDQVMDVLADFVRQSRPPDHGPSA